MYKYKYSILVYSIIDRLPKLCQLVSVRVCVGVYPVPWLPADLTVGSLASCHARFTLGKFSERARAEAVAFVMVHRKQRRISLRLAVKCLPKGVNA